MEISSLTLSTPRSPPSVPFASSQSMFLTNNGTTNLFMTRNKVNISGLVLGRSRTERARKGLTCNALFGLGVPELAVIAGVAALVFGPKKLPEVGKSLGKTIKSFQQAAKEFETELKKEPEPNTEVLTDEPTTVSEEQKPEVKVPSSQEKV
ncbi:PREDICTED: sec-independent protein translocase protein TATA, chloroplastic [Fragaria vesca subsp. vesca]|uniref:sec-independent protein translocase protein TATA, chloroplastic n=1 Tax=Fragaria vesca subsp. vesca TaxID=101020 RepID=UPI0002C2F8EF|nr:PREDICTED: sec-independent protein translocase protein TATA, chloroplastic [Fragaria vesca subsp. vesca]